MTVQELEDEISAIDAIFEGSVEAVAPQIYNFKLSDHEDMRIQLSFPTEYPEVPPQILQVIVYDTRKYTDANYLESKVQEHLDRTFHVGEVCLFDLFTDLEDFLKEYKKEPVEEEPVKEEPKIENQKPKEPTPEVVENSTTEVIDATAGWIQSDPIIDRQSTFIAYVRKVESVEEAEALLSLLITDKKILRATHNISSWRIRRDDGIQFQDCDDDGETAAGGRLLHLLTVCMTRFYLLQY